MHQTIIKPPLYQMLGVQPGITAVIGAGGKSTLIQVLAEELSGAATVIVTTSTHIFRPNHWPVVQREEQLQAALQRASVVCVGTDAKDNKLTAAPIPIKTLKRLAKYVLVEADGAAGLPLKLHQSHEPVIPAEADRVIAVCGMDALNEPIRQALHRPAHGAAFLQQPDEHSITTQDIITILDTYPKIDVLLLNKVETAQRLQAAKDIAAAVRGTVVTASLQHQVWETAKGR